MGFHHLGIAHGRVMMFMVWLMAMAHIFVAVTMVKEKLKLLVLAGMLTTRTTFAHMDLLKGPTLMILPNYRDLTRPCQMKKPCQAYRLAPS